MHFKWEMIAEGRNQLKKKKNKTHNDKTETQAKKVSKTYRNQREKKAAASTYASKYPPILTPNQPTCRVLCVCVYVLIVQGPNHFWFSGGSEFLPFTLMKCC